MRSAVDKRREAEDLWNDPNSFSAALAVQLGQMMPEYPFPDLKWSWLTRKQQHIVAERLLEEAIGRHRTGRVFILKTKQIQTAKEN